MTIKNFLLVFCLIFGFNLPFVAAISQTNSPDLSANQTNVKIDVDGHLTESAWQSLQFSDSFYQREPGDGTTPTERTAVGCLYNRNYLYLGVCCFDCQPEKIVRSELRRDAYMDHEDYFEMVLDTYRDYRNGFYFIFNAYGNKRDARITDEGRTFNANWDGIWECQTRITEKGWFAEVAIPWKTLRFISADSLYFGVNFGRMIRRKNERIEWVNSPREMGAFALFRLSLAGRVGPFVGVHSGGHIELKPFFTSGMEKDVITANELKAINEVGIDTKVNLSSNLVADITLNTDFAQVEADQEQVNLSRFSLYFPEKREFFLEGAEIFRTESSMNEVTGQSDDLILFYSRKIGIEESQRIPLLGGLKLTGRINRTTLGALSMQTRRYQLDETTELPVTRFDVLRVRQELFERSSMGMLITNKVGGHRNQSVTTDFRLTPSPYLTFSGLLSGTHTSDSSNYRSFAGNLSAGWHSDRYQWRAGFTDIEPNFNAETGFIRRRDIRKTSSSFYFTPRPEENSRIRKFIIGFWGSYLTNTQNELRERYFGAELGLQLHSSAKVKFQFSREYDYLNSDWELRPNLLIPARIYEGNSLYALFVTDVSKPVSAIARLTVSDYYTGTRYAFGGQIDYKGFSRFKFNSNFELNRILLPKTLFNTLTISNRIVYAFSTRLYAKAYIQHNHDPLRFNDRIKLSHHLLIRYIYRPGSNFYLVYNHEQLFGGDAAETRNQTVLAKLIYFWRK